MIAPKHQQKESVSARVLRSPIFVAASGIAVILTAAAFDNLRQVLTLEGLMIGTALFLFVVVINLAIAGVISKLNNQETFDQRLDTLNTIILNNNLHWLVNQKYVQMLEMQADEIWAFAPELTFAIEEGSEIFKAVQTTLARGAKYKIFMPNRPETHKIIADYKRLHRFKDGQVQFILIPHEEYVFHTIISVYDPHTARPRAIEWLAVEGLVAWLEMDTKHAQRMVGVGEVLTRRYQESLKRDALIREVPRTAPAGRKPKSPAKNRAEKAPH
jgi:hypothetical protein